MKPVETLKRNVTVNGKVLEVEVTIYSADEWDMDVRSDDEVSIHDVAKAQFMVKQMVSERMNWQHRRPTFQANQSASA